MLNSIGHFFAIPRFLSIYSHFMDKIKTLKNIQQIGAGSLGAVLLSIIPAVSPISETKVAEFAPHSQNPIDNILVQQVCAKGRCGECTLTGNVPGITTTFRGKRVCVQCNVDIKSLKFNPNEVSLDFLK
jgi:hypothetical protein